MKKGKESIYDLVKRSYKRSYSIINTEKPVETADSRDLILINRSCNQTGIPLQWHEF
jgi:hypothetical protein